MSEEKKIIEINQQPEEGPQPEFTALTMEKAARLAGAIRRKKVLMSQKISTAQKDAELRGINALLVTELMNHADELVGSWFGIHNEYQPIVDALTALFARIQQNIDYKKAQVEARREAEEKSE